MPDENRFSGLADVVDADEEAGDDAEATEANDEEPVSESDAETALDDPSAPGPAFEFEETTAKSVYVRPETLSVLDDAEFEVESVLRRDHDVRDLTGREFHDALVRVAAAHPEAVAELVLEARETE
ncbi:hypothetical protein [Halogeometricum limi]|uniref:Uncharacterized protein n=1 Tax=Halogeometricum limi TaxID=555875 RepID=A0A1I6ILP3_9EURY|nr:hypothetical protein [Halogeometricum limi]SFR67665.1 hypothetical protein SAMN04488124_3389 [Halogeometricum limi]